jgi:hypothetical protein
MSDYGSDYSDIEVEELVHYSSFSERCPTNYRIYNTNTMIELPYKLDRCYKVEGVPYIIKVIDMDVWLRRREIFSPDLNLNYSLYRIKVKILNEQTRFVEEKTIKIEPPLEYTAAMHATIPFADVQQATHGFIRNGTITRSTPIAIQSTWRPENDGTIINVSPSLAPLDDNDELLKIKISNGDHDIREVECPKELKSFGEKYCSIMGGRRRKFRKSKKTRKSRKTIKSKKSRKCRNK